MNHLLKYLHLYIGCDTNKGKLIGIKKDQLFIESENNIISEVPVTEVGKTIFFYMRKLNAISNDESKQLIKEGISIGRPNGYTFSNKGFIYLLELRVDLFGFIDSGLAVSFME